MDGPTNRPMDGWTDPHKESRAVPDPLKGTKSTGLRPCASRGLAPQGALTGLLGFLEEGKGKTEKEEKQAEKKRKRRKMERKKG